MCVHIPCLINNQVQSSLVQSSAAIEQAVVSPTLCFTEEKEQDEADTDDEGAGKDPIPMPMLS